MSTHGLKFTLASPEDDLIIRELLRRIPMNRQIGITFQREPNYFAGEHIGTLRSVTFILTDEKRSRAYAIATRSVMKIHSNGVATEVGYLSNLRSDPCVRGGRYLLYGFRFLRKLCDEDPVPYNITTIFDDNIVVKNLLEGGRLGLPRYIPIGKLVTYLIPLTKPTKRFSDKVISRESSLSEREGLRVPGKYYQITGNGRETSLVTGDYSQYKQVVVSSYSQIMSCLRGVYNFYARTRSLPRLPDVGDRVRLTYIKRLVSGTSDLLRAEELLRHVVSDMSGHGYDYLVLGLMSDDPLSCAVEKIASRKEISTVYQVMWNDENRLPTSNLRLEVVAL